MWCGVARCGVVWCSKAWCGVAWCDVVWRGVVWRGMAWCDLATQTYESHHLIDQSLIVTRNSVVILLFVTLFLLLFI